MAAVWYKMIAFFFRADEGLIQIGNNIFFALNTDR
jgi:hypothetical protein